MIGSMIMAANTSTEMINIVMLILLFLSLILGVYLLACAPCRQHLLNGLKKLVLSPKCLVCVALTVLFTIIAVYTIDGRKEVGIFNREIKCTNSTKNEYGVFLTSGDCKCEDCSSKTTPKTPIDAPVVSDSK